jgi:hypothetical protein
MTSLYIAKNVLPIHLNSSNQLRKQKRRPVAASSSVKSDLAVNINDNVRAFLVQPMTYLNKKKLKTDY